MLGCSGSNKKETKIQSQNNIIIKSPEFKTVLKNFYKDAIYYNSPDLRNDTISVFIGKYGEGKYKESTGVALYSFKKLDNDYIGEANLDNLKVLFYNKDLELTKDFIDVKPIRKNIINKQKLDKKSNIPPTYKETYEKFYTYKDGKLTLIRIE